MGVVTKDRNSILNSSETVLPESVDDLRNILLQAINLGASDVHIEPTEQPARIRFRIGNRLEPGTLTDNDKLARLADSAKQLAKLSEASQEKIQEANFVINLEGQEHTIALSTIPVIDGEKMVLHLSPKTPIGLSLKQLGFWGNNLKQINAMLAGLRGAIMIASADRNSGNQTLLGIAKLIDHPSLKIAALGDPLIDHLHIADRIRVDASTGLTKKRGLKQALEDDPKVLFITDTLDRDIIKIALEAAGKRLVCLNVPAENIPQLVQQLARLEVGKDLLSTNLRLLSSQCLIPRLCVNCRQAFNPSGAYKTQLEHLTRGFKQPQIHKFEKGALKAGIGTDVKTLSTNEDNIIRLWKASDKGCEKCNFSSHKGYTTANEVLDTTASPAQKLLSKASVSLSEIHDALISLDMVPQHIDGLIKCLRGVVDINQVLELAKINGYTL